MYADTKHHDQSFSVGDSVLLNSGNIHLQYQTARPSRKLLSKFIGPYKILEVISKVAYCLDLLDSLRIHPVFHVLLLYCYVLPDTIPGHSVPNRPPVVSIDNHEEFYIEVILDKHIRHNWTQYLVKWDGYPEYDSTWEPVTNLEHSRKAITDFEALGQ